MATYTATHRGKSWQKNGKVHAYTHALVRDASSNPWVTSWHTSKAAAEKRLAGWADSDVVMVECVREG